jgi:hypothetical protein
MNLARLAQFWSQVEKTKTCWNWVGKLGRAGYGDFDVMQQYRRTRGAHRVSYELHGGKIPDGLFVCHKCDNRKCVNPAHLFLGTNSDNMLDAVSKGRVVSPHANKTHCLRGHSLADFWPTAKGGRNCKQCHRIRCAKYGAK